VFPEVFIVLLAFTEPAEPKQLGGAVSGGNESREVHSRPPCHESRRDKSPDPGNPHAGLT
jgi:hypothetical protein